MERDQPCLCLCLGFFEQITRKRPFRFTNLQPGQKSFSADRTLIVLICEPIVLKVNLRPCPNTEHRRNVE